MNDIEVRRIYRSYVSGRIRASREGCPPIKDIRGAFEAKARRTAKDRIVDHISDCAYCAEEFEFVRAVRTREGELAEGIRAIARHRRSPILLLSRPLWNYACVMALIAVVISGIVVFKNARPREEVRNRSATIPEALAPSGHIDEAPPLIFKWKRVEGAISYIVEIYDESLQLVWESPPISTTAAILPAPVEEALAADADYYWSVSALDSKGLIGGSRFAVFSVDP